MPPSSGWNSCVWLWMSIFIPNFSAIWPWRLISLAVRFTDSSVSEGRCGGAPAPRAPPRAPPPPPPRISVYRMPMIRKPSSCFSKSGPSVAPTCVLGALKPWRSSMARNCWDPCRHNPWPARPPCIRSRLLWRGCHRSPWAAGRGPCRVPGRFASSTRRAMPRRIRQCAARGSYSLQEGAAVGILHDADAIRKMSVRESCTDQSNIPLPGSQPGAFRGAPAGAV